MRHFKRSTPDLTKRRPRPQTPPTPSPPPCPPKPLSQIVPAAGTQPQRHPHFSPVQQQRPPQQQQQQQQRGAPPRNATIVNTNPTQSKKPQGQKKKKQPDVCCVNSTCMAEVFDHGVAMNPDPRVLTWQRLEALRFKKLGLTPDKFVYSRHFSNVLRNPTLEATSPRVELAGTGTGDVTISQALATASFSQLSLTPDPHTNSNSVAPFATVQKPTCGYYFTDKTNNKKVNFGIPASDLVKWRSHNTATNQG